MPTQQEIADHLGLNQSEVSRHMSSLGLDWKSASLTDIRLAYCRHLRGVASGHRSEDGMDLTRERALTEQVDRELKLLTLAEKKGAVVSLAQLEPELARMIGAFRSELLARDDKLKGDIDALYGVDLDLGIIHEHTRNALEQLARYDPERAGFDAPPGAPAQAVGAANHDQLGEEAPALEREGDGHAGRIQP